MIIRAITKIVKPKMKNRALVGLENSFPNPTASGTKNAARENKIIACATFEKAEDNNFHCSCDNFGPFIIALQ